MNGIRGLVAAIEHHTIAFHQKVTSLDLQLFDHLHAHVRECASVAENNLANDILVVDARVVHNEIQSTRRLGQRKRRR